MKLHQSALRLYFFILYSWLCILGVQSTVAHEVLNSSQINDVAFTVEKNVPLTGIWQFYPNQLLIYPSAELVSQQVELPASFQQLIGRNQGYGSFVAQFKIPKAFVGRRIAILVPYQPAAYRMYLNGNLLLRSGHLSIDPDQQSVERSTRIGYFIPQEQNFTLTIQASSHHHFYGGMESAMKIGLARTIDRKFHLYMMSIGLFCGAILGLGFFTLVFSLFKGTVSEDRKSMFMFSMFIIFLALHNLFAAPHAYTFFTNIDWALGIRLQYFFSLSVIGFFLTYVHWTNARYLHRWLYVSAMLVLAFDLGVLIVVEPEIFEILVMVSTTMVMLILANFLYGFYQTLRHREPFSYVNIVAVIFLFLTFTNDLLLMFGLHDFIYLSFISTSLYTLLIMFQQARHYAFQTFHTEQLNIELRQLNESLDHKVKARTLELHELNEKLELQVRTDALTGAFNRLALNEEIQRCFAHVQQLEHTSLTFAMLDVDFFKNYNDYYGHLKGDDILRNLVQILKQSLPDSAFLARYGGEEFAVLISNVPCQIVEQIFEQALNAVRQANLEHNNRPDQKGYISLSIGMAFMHKDAAYQNIYELMKAADQHLYAAKIAGRDQLHL